MNHPTHRRRARPMRARAAGATVVAALLGWAAPGPAAAEAGSVTLVFDNGLDGENLSGTLQDYDGTRYLLDSPIGVVAVPAEGVSCIGAACPEGRRLKIETPVLVLTSLDGASVVSGNLIVFEDGAYVLATDAGELRVPADLVTCAGEGCAPIPAAVIGGPATLFGPGAPIDGTLLAIEEGHYVMDVSGFGQLRVSTEDYECLGPGCP